MGQAMKFRPVQGSDVDDVNHVTTASVSIDPNDSALQAASDNLSLWCNENGMILNIQKTKRC